MSASGTGARMRAALAALRDVSGVTGSFVVTEAGELVGTDLPAVFVPAFREVAPRLARLLDASAVLGERTRACTLRFAEHKLYAAAIDDAVLGVLLSVNTSIPALKVAVSLVSRRIQAVRAQQRDSAPPTPSAPPSSPASAPPDTPGSTRRTLRFRGRPVE